MRDPFLCFLILAIGVGLCGCGSRELQTRPVVPVSIQVVYRDKPPAGAQVVLHPTQPDAEGFVLVRPRGIVAANGSVRLTTFHTDDGAPEGDYIVTIVWPPPMAEGASDDDKVGPDKLGGRYADPSKSTLRAAVRKDLSEPLRIQIK